jgi:hypothetical protein
MKRNLLFLLLFVASATQLSAQAALNIQGTIQNFDGSIVDDGDYDITFNLYTVDNGGTAVWTETQTVAVSGGIYSVLLGTVNPLNISFSELYYLGITLPGAPELVPRSSLTAAPYTFSLIGQDNTFPSSGTIGIGTATPNSGVEMHVKDVEAKANLLVESTSDDAVVEVKASQGVPEIVVNSTTPLGDFPKFEIKKEASTASVSLSQGDLNFSTTKPGFNIKFNNNNNAVIHVNKNGSINFLKPILTTNDNFNFFVDNSSRFTIDENAIRVVNKPLIVSGSASETFNYALYQYQFGGFYTGSPATVSYSINAASNIITPNLYINSDRRIKKDISTSNSGNDLAELLRLRVADYRMKDEVTQGSKMHKGFIAQEVAELLPDAVGKVTAVVPDIYSLSKGTGLNGQELTILLGNKHGLKVGEKVKLISEKDISGSLFEVSSINGENSFTVNGWTAGPVADVFVYGREVDDFHNINYDYLYTLNVSATQELVSRLLGLNKENEGLRGEVKVMNERLLNLETRVIGSAKR